MIATRLSEMLRLQYPVLLAPMGSVSGGGLAATVSNAGGLGLVGGGYGDPRWLRTELARAKDEARAPWGVGFITWSVDRSIVELALEYGPSAVMLSFGDAAPYAALVKSAGAKLICQVQEVDDAVRAVEAGADVIVAQGSEAGGHTGDRATLPLVPAVVDAVAPTPVVAAGGIADGRGLAAALMLGAQGALIGTRFYASHEALGRPAAKQRILEARAKQTVRTRLFDVVRGLAWPDRYAGRAVRNRFVDRWDGDEAALAAQCATEGLAYRQAVERDDFATAVVWAGEAVDLIKELDGAANLVARIATEAAMCLRNGARLAR